MNTAELYLAAKLLERQNNQSLRKLKTTNGLIDFCSNDYLGFAQSIELKHLVEQELSLYPHYKLGATGSRLISGNDEFTENLENEIAHFHNAEAGLIFNSGYDANVGLFSSIANRNDTIIADELIHASIIDGIRLSNATRFTFKHNDLGSLERKIKVAKGQIYIVVESVYSMDGDKSPLTEIVKLAELYEAAVIVDEAHAIGLYGLYGCGLVCELNLQNRVFARVVTFGKALGCHGAIVLGSKLLRGYLVNFARSFIYSTAAPFLTHLTIAMAYSLLKDQDFNTLIGEKISLFKEHFSKIELIVSDSAIQSIIVGGNQPTKNAAQLLFKQGFDVRPILSPTVTAGKERLRICLHLFNTNAEIIALTQTLNNIL